MFHPVLKYVKCSRTFDKYCSIAIEVLVMVFKFSDCSFTMLICHFKVDLMSHYDDGHPMPESLSNQNLPMEKVYR